MTEELTTYNQWRSEIEAENAPFAGRKVIYNSSNRQFWRHTDIGWVWTCREDLEALRDHIENDPCAWEHDRQLAREVSKVLEEADG